jgi:hypothetical protein
MRLRVADIEQGLGTSETAAHARAAAMLSAAYHAYGRDLRVPRPAPPPSTSTPTLPRSRLLPVNFLHRRHR